MGPNFTPPPLTIVSFHDHQTAILNQQNCISEVKETVIVLDCVLSCIRVDLLHLPIARDDIKDQHNKFPRLDILSSTACILTRYT